MKYFLEISKAFERVLHEALIFKSQSYVISDSSLCLFNSFLIFVNDILAKLEVNVKIFTDDTSLFTLICDPNERSAIPGRELLDGNISGRCHSTLIFLSKLWRFTVPIRLTRCIHHPFILISQ